MECLIYIDKSMPMLHNSRLPELLQYLWDQSIQDHPPENRPKSPWRNWHGIILEQWRDMQLEKNEAVTLCQAFNVCLYKATILEKSILSCFLGLNYVKAESFREDKNVAVPFLYYYFGINFFSSSFCQPHSLDVNN